MRICIAFISSVVLAPLGGRKPSSRILPDPVGSERILCRPLPDTSRIPLARPVESGLPASQYRNVQPTGESFPRLCDSPIYAIPIFVRVRLEMPSELRAAPTFRGCKRRLSPER
jgi:hypothetical protein